MIIYLTSDISSPHTSKRARWFSNNGFDYELYGFENQSNTISLEQEPSDPFLKIKSGPFNYFKRIVAAFKLCFELNKELRQGIIIVRGFEYLLPLKLFGFKFYYELTDIPEIFFRLKSLRLIFKFLLQDSKLLVTSIAYNEVLKLDEQKILIWHNDPVLSTNYQDNIVITEKSTKRIIYSGYLRGLKKLIQDNSGFLQIDFYGKCNILGEKYNFKEFLNGYKGEYNPHELYKIFNKYWFSYISDTKGKNSKYNLTNRLYESILHFSIPVEFQNNYQSEFLRKEKIFFISNTKCETDLTLKQLHEISVRNHKILSKLIEKDNNSIVNEFKNTHYKF